MRILYYCQSLVGVGHLACSLRIIQELVPYADVDLIHGGLDTATMIEHPRFRSLRLATLLHDAESGSFFDPHQAHTVDSIWALRSAQIAAFLRGRYDGIVVEFYPFGRRRFKAEIMELFRAVQATSGAVPIFTSVREVLIPRPLEKERRMVATVRKHIHTVFVRSDPEVIRLDDTFSLTHEIQDRLVYTGYISPPAPGVWPARKKQILVSQGGGNVGAELLQAAIRVAPLMPDYRFVLAAGSRTPAVELAALQAGVRSANVQITPFVADFQHRLWESAASISMGGDNTLLDVITARTPALAYPYQGKSGAKPAHRQVCAEGIADRAGCSRLGAREARIVARACTQRAGTRTRHRIGWCTRHRREDPRNSRRRGGEPIDARGRRRAHMMKPSWRTPALLPLRAIVVTSGCAPGRMQ